MTRSRRRRRTSVVSFAVPSVRGLFAAEITTVTTTLALLAADVPVEWTLTAAATVSLVPFVAFRRTSIAGWLVVALRFGSGRAPAVGVTTEHVDPDGRPVAVHWQRDTVTCTVEIIAPEHDTTVLARTRADTRHTLPIEALTSCFRQHDVEVAAIDIVALGFRTADGSVATDVYEGLIGPLPAVAQRTVWVSVTLDVRANALAMAARGTGRTGAARTAVVAALRIARALESHGLSTRLSTATELRAAALHLSRGVDTDDLTQVWSYAPLPGVASTGYGIDCSTITVEDLSALWATPSLGTTMSVHLRPTDEPSRVRVRASCRFAAREAISRPDVASLTSMAGRQRDGILAQLPLAVATHSAVMPVGTLSTSALQAWAFPVSGCGQLLGSDTNGNGVAVRIFGANLPRVSIVGELYLAQQLLFRAVAIGARVVVRTDRPHAWGALRDAIGEPKRFLVDSDHTRVRPSYDVVVVDFADGSISLDQQSVPGVTVISLTEHEPPHDPAAPGPSRQEFAAMLSIVQPRASGDRIRVRSGPIDIELTLVTIPQETAFIGRPRSLRPAVRV